MDLSEVLWTEPLAKTSKDPAIGPWPSPSPHKPIQAMLVAAVLALFALPSYAQQSGGWGNAREFNLTNAFSASSDWSASGSTWRTSDAFERSAPSIAPAEVQDFALRQGAEPLDQLLDVIASAEAGPAGYDAIHMSASRLNPCPTHAADPRADFCMDRRHPKSAPCHRAISVHPQHAHASGGS